MDIKNESCKVSKTMVKTNEVYFSLYSQKVERIKQPCRSNTKHKIISLHHLSTQFLGAIGCQADKVWSTYVLVLDKSVAGRVGASFLTVTIY